MDSNAIPSTSDIRKEFNRKFSPNLSVSDDASSILGVNLPHTSGGPRVPKLERFRSNALTDYDLELMKKIAVGIDLNIPLLIEGGSGIGKSETIERVCALLNRECYYANCHDFTADVLIGTMGNVAENKSGFGWIDGVVLQAIRNGGVLFLDEYNFMLGETRGRLHEILDAILRGKNEITLVENKSERVAVHPDFRIVAAQNPPGQGYTDRYFLDPAQITRFHYLKEPSELTSNVKLVRTLQYLGVDTETQISRELFLDSSNSITKKQLLEVPGMGAFLLRFANFHDALTKQIFERDLAADQSQPVYLSFQRELNRILRCAARYWNGNLEISLARSVEHFYLNLFESSEDRVAVTSLVSELVGGLKREATKYKPHPPQSDNLLNNVVISETRVDFFGVKLDRGEGGNCVPKEDRFKENVITDFDRLLMQKIAISIALNQPLLIEGGSGIGKSEITEWVCSLLDRECYYANCHDFTADVLIGGMTVKDETKSGFGWIDGIVIEAIRNGGVLFLDEYNFMNGEARGRLHEILDTVLRGNKSIILVENSGEVVPVHPSFRLIAAQNPPGDVFLDRTVLDPAQMTRFVYVREASEMPLALKRARALALVGEHYSQPLPAAEVFRLGNQTLTHDQLSQLPGALELVCDKFLDFHKAIDAIVRNGGLAENQAQPVYFAFQRDFDRVVNFICHFYDGDLNATMRAALVHYFVNRFESRQDRDKVIELISHVHVSLSHDTRRRIVREVRVSPPSGIEIQGLALLAELRARGLPENDYLCALAGFQSDEADMIREQSVGTNPVEVLASLTGVDHQPALMMRRRIFDNMARHNHKVAEECVNLSLRGLDSVDVEKLRKDLKIKANILSATALDTPRGRQLRADHRALQTSKRGVPENWFADLIKVGTSLDTFEAKEDRKRAFAVPARKGDALMSYAYIDSVESEMERQHYCSASHDQIGAVLEGLAGNNTAFAWRIRRDCRNRSDLREHLCISLAGLDSEQAWKMRRELAAEATNPQQLAWVGYSITGGPFLASVRRAVQDRAVARMHYMQHIAA